MYHIIASILLKFGLGFISDKFRTYGAEKLQDGDLADQKLRGWIVRELDDIKFKLDGLSRKDLATSVSFLKQGVERLHMCLEESFESGDPSTSELPNNKKQLQDTTNVGESTTTKTKPVAVEDAVALANAIGKLKIKSNGIFELAKESLKKAAEKASEAFHNAALSTEERVLASEVRIASGILEHLERPEVAAIDCLQYLQELHDMPVIKDIFSVQVKRGIKSFIKSRFKKDSRAAVVETVTMINLMLADYISKFTKRRMAVFDWPVIECGKRVVHPIYYKEESVRKMKELGMTTPWNIVTPQETAAWSYAINSKGDVIGVNEGGLRKFDKATGDVQPFCLSDSDDKTRSESVVAVDDNDMVYVLSYRMFSSLTMNCGPTLSVYSPDGQIIRRSRINFIEEEPHCIAVTKDEKIVICSRNLDGTVYVHVRDSNKKVTKGIPIRLQSKLDIVVSMIVSCDNEIILTTRVRDSDSRKDGIVLYVCTQEGELIRTLKLPLSQSFTRCLTSSIIFDRVRKNYVVYSRDHDTGKTSVQCFSETGDRQNILRLDDMKYISGSDRRFFLVSNANGVIALVNERSVLYLR